MACGRVFFLFGILVLGLAVGNGRVLKDSSSSCAFPAIYNFGDSNSDVGEQSAAIVQIPPPNGETFFKKPSGRFSDGRLIIDFIAENLGLPFLSPYLDSIGTNFEHGANFAAGGASMRPGVFSPFDLGVQISQFIQFKSRTAALFKNNSDPGILSLSKGGLPRSRDFSKALYTLDIGQNDLTLRFLNMTEDQVRADIPNILIPFTPAVQQLYEEGARAFWVHNTGPIGCLPLTAIRYWLKNGTLDQNGCAKPQNDVAQEFNRQLKDRVTQLREQFPLAAFTYVDVYSAKFTLISNAKNLGFVDPLNSCCGSLYPNPVFCGSKVEVNGTTIYGNACDDPSTHISWDGVHYTEAANLWVATRILNGSMSDPPVPITKACP